LREPIRWALGPPSPVGRRADSFAAAEADSFVARGGERSGIAGANPAWVGDAPISSNELGFGVALLSLLEMPSLTAFGPPLAERFQAAPEAPQDPTPVEVMAHRLKTPVGRALYALRKQMPEPVFGIIKSTLGFRRPAASSPAATITRLWPRMFLSIEL